MSYLPPFVVHGTHLLREEGIAEYAVQYKKLLLGLRDDQYGDDQFKDIQYSNQLIP